MSFSTGQEVGTKFLIGKFWIGKVTWIKIIDKETFDDEWSKVRTTSIAYELSSNGDYTEVLTYTLTMLKGGLDVIRNRM